MKSKGVRSKGYRLSPNEEARIIQEETEKRRKLRLLQVRELSKHNAANIRESVKAEKQKQIQKLAQKVERELKVVQDEEVSALEARYENCVRTIGIGHKGAEEQVDRESKLRFVAEENNRKAEIRYKKALELLQSEQQQQMMEDNYHIMSRKAALEVEKIRASQIASLPPPPPDPTLQLVNTKRKARRSDKPVKMTDASAYSLTHFHMAQNVAVERENPQFQEDARVLAVDEEERMRDEDRRIKQSEQGLRERARLRHIVAREKEILKQDYEHMLHDLSDLQRADMYRRQKVVANIPKQVFQPPHRRLEDRVDKQRTMEQAFENMYMRATDFTGDLSLALDPHVQTEIPTVTDSLELSVMSEEGHAHNQSVTQTDRRHPMQQLPRTEILKDVTNIAKESGGHSPEKSETVLKKLFNQIKNQRDEWISRSSQDTAEQEDVISMSPQLFTKPPPSAETQHPHQQSAETQQQSTKPVSIPTDYPPATTKQQELSPPATDYPNKFDIPVADREAVDKELRDLTDSHQRRVEEARQELQEIQEKKAALEEKLRQYGELQQKNDMNLVSNLVKQNMNQDIHPDKCQDEIHTSKTRADKKLLPPDDILADASGEKDYVVDPQKSAIDSKLSEIDKPGGADIDDQTQKQEERTESEQVRRIKEYQQRLLERHKSWKMLADTRAEIERRRNELRRRYPQLNLPQMENLPWPTSDSIGVSVPTTYNNITSASTQIEPLSGLTSVTAAAVKTLPSVSVTARPTASFSTVTSGVATAPLDLTTCGTTAVQAVRTQTDHTTVQAGGITAINPPILNSEASKSDDVRKQLLFDSETPYTSPEKGKAVSLLERLTDDLEQDSSPVEDSNVPSSSVGLSTAYPIAVPLGQSRVRRHIQVSPSNTTASPAVAQTCAEDSLHTVDKSPHFTEIDPIQALTNAAKERKCYFEKRQRQLSEQLQEIQEQKAAYLSQHEETQRKLKEHRESMLREGLQSLPLTQISAQSSDKEHAPDNHTDETDHVYRRLVQNESITSDTSLSRKTWADLLQESAGSHSAYTQPQQPLAEDNSSPGSALANHQHHELSTIIEMDTPPQSRSLSSSHRSSGRNVHLSQDKAASRPLSHEGLFSHEGSVYHDEYDRGYEPLISGLTVSKSSDRTVSEATAALCRARELLSSSDLPDVMETEKRYLHGSKPTPGQDSESDFVSATSGSYSQHSADVSLPQLREGLADSSAWRSSLLRCESSPHGSELTQYTAPSESAPSNNGSDMAKSADSLTQYRPHSTDSLSNLASALWKSHEQRFSPSEGSELTQYSSTSCQDPSAKVVRSSDAVRTVGFSDGHRDRHSADQELYRSPAELELTQFSLGSEKSSTSNQDKFRASVSAAIPDVIQGNSSEVRPKSATSVSGSELTQYSCSPTLDGNGEEQGNMEQHYARPGTQVSGKEEPKEWQSHYKSPSQNGAAVDVPQSLNSICTADRRALSSRDSNSTLTQYSDSSLGESLQKYIDLKLELSRSLHDTTRKSGTFGQQKNKAENLEHSNRSSFQQTSEQNNNAVETTADSSTLSTPLHTLPHLQIPLDTCIPSTKKDDVFHAVKVFIEPPNDQSSPQVTERSCRDDTSHSLGMEERSGPSESSSYMTLPSLTRTNPLISAELSAFHSQQPGQSMPDTLETFFSPGYKHKSDDFRKTTGFSTNVEDSLAYDLQKWKEYLHLDSPDKTEVSVSEMGITDEADLTLVSCASLSSPSRLYSDSQSESLVSFERHEVSVEDITPRLKSDIATRIKPDSGPGHDDIVICLEPGQTQGKTDKGVTLQDAFLARKKGFASSSERRVLEAKKRAQGVTPSSGLTKTIVSWKKSRGMKASSKSSPGLAQRSQKAKTTADRKKQEMEKIERTKRLYNQLEEVKEMNEMKEREKQYAANRDKAKLYHKKLQEKLKKQRSSKKYM